MADAKPAPASKAPEAHAPQQPENDQSLATMQTESEVLKQIQQAIDANTHPSDLLIARLAIMQGLSPEIADQVPGYKQGMLIDNVTRSILTDYIKPPWLKAAGVADEELTPVHCLLLVPMFKLPTEFIKWIPRDERKETDEFPYEWKTLDRNDPRVKEGVWRSLGGTFKGKRPPVTDNTNYLIGPIDLQTKMLKCNPLVATFSRTSSPAGKQLTTQVASHKMQNLMPWDRCYWLWTKQEEYDDGKAYVMQIARGPLLSECAEKIVRVQVIEQAKALSQPKIGQVFQEMMINAAFFGDDHGTGDGEALSTGNQQTAEDDPFGKE